MYLKSLKLVGFKSFADRTRLELRPGVTVIVGPNGSGKSNLVDAVSWVMGTQSPKSLRTPKMEDVVFAGTATRPALNRAEATLVLDNESRTLPLDLDEVSITRRLYRDGSSDYELNGVPCRLLDISELLSDSGVGRHQHVIVGQGQIESVLSSGPADHRAVIEEAAGILKHRQRKDRAIRRLERTDADLVRITDIVGELVRQMRPLKRQANAAQQQANLAEQVRAIRLYVGGERLRHFEARAGGLNEEQSELKGQVSEGQVEVDELASALFILTQESAGVGEALDRDTGAAARLETILERLRRVASVAHERYQASKSRREGLAERRSDLEDEIQTIEVELSVARVELAAGEEESSRRERQFRTLEDEARSLADQESLSPEGALAVVRGDLRSLQGAETRDKRERDQAIERRKLVVAQLADDEGEADALKDEIRLLDSRSGELADAYESATAQRQVRQDAWESAEAALSHARLARATAGARVEAVAAALEERADPRARQIVESAEGNRGRLATLLDVPPDLAAAVQAALGPWSESIAFDSTDNLSQVVSILKQEGLGGMSLVSRVSTSPGPAILPEGTERLIDRLGPGADRSLASHLIGDVILVEGWAGAVRLVGTHPQLTIVTPEGDLIRDGAIRAAQPDGATTVMLEAAEVGLERADRELARAESLHSTAKRDFEITRNGEREALEALEALEAKLSGATETLGRLNRTLSTLEGELARLDDRIEAVSEASDERRLNLDRLQSRFAALEGEEAERQRAWEEVDSRRIAIEDDRETARAAWQQAAADFEAARQRVDLLERRRHDVTNELAVDHPAPVRDEDLERLELVDAMARQGIEVLSERLSELRTRQSELRSRARIAGDQREAVRKRHEECRSLLEKRRARLAQIDVEATEIRVRRESVAEGLRRDADADETAALAAPSPEIDGHGNGTDWPALLEDIEARLRRMGPVNPLAADEYAELEERHGFLSGQVSDLEKSKQDLRGVIAALDDEIQQRFTVAYDEVAAAFSHHFSILFPGGSGRLSLTESDDRLASGVEIEAQPLGKKVSQLSLLSGGERSLAALAFLFSVFRARPSPFYVLDEVEAALDDANLRRFLRLVEAFRGDAQLVIVTHQQQTMEVANVLYGVTLEPGGSSAVVRKEISPAQQRLSSTNLA